MGCVWTVESHDENSPSVQLLTAAEYFILHRQYRPNLHKVLAEDIHDLFCLNFSRDVINEENEEPTVSEQLVGSETRPALETYVLVEGAIHTSKGGTLVIRFRKELAPEQWVVALLFISCNIHQAPFPRIRVLDLLQT